MQTITFKKPPLGANWIQVQKFSNSPFETKLMQNLNVSKPLQKLFASISVQRAAADTSRMKAISPQVAPHSSQLTPLRAALVLSLTLFVSRENSLNICSEKYLFKFVGFLVY
ncbi:unnamed protein product [Chrysodeixis includens]|uniref:Uncharacterized protein n=1 Tax=Chrysodeixis includens TaxID=689277 RepID=A0A9N8KR15_CHRIL|nr:unnamed protein product [Chrysodeixis includens]